MRRSLYFGLFFLLLFSFLATHAYAGVGLAIDSQAVHFGDVYLPNHRELTVTITDTGTTPVDIIDVTPFAAASSDYTIIAPTFPQTLQAQASISVTIRFTPQAEGQRSALLTVHTADGDVSIVMNGTGKVEHSTLSFSVPEIDIGKVAPDLYKDSLIEIYSTGLDSATIYRVIVGGADTSVTAYIDGVTEYPIRLAPGDSLPVRVRFTGLLPTGQKQGLLSVVGGNDPTISVWGDVEWGAYDFVPETVDFGGMYIGEERDTTLYLQNSSDVDIQVTELDPAYGSFSYVNPPAVPFIIRAHDQIALTLRANPGRNTYNTPDVGAFSANAAQHEPKAFFILTLKNAGLDAPHSQSADYFCAKPGPTDVSVPITDTVPVPFYITKIVSLDSTIAVTSDLALPDTIRANETHNFPLHISAPNRALDTVILEFYTGDRKTLFDTIYITGRASLASSDLVEVPIADSLRAAFEVHTATQLSPFALDTIVAHLAVSDPNALDIDTTTLSLMPGMTSAKIVRIVKEASGYAVWIASTVPIVAPTGSGLLSFTVKRYVSAADSASLTIAFETPERSGCLEWSGATTNVPLLAVCGADEIREMLSSAPYYFKVTSRENPVTVAASFDIYTSAASDIYYEVRNVLGERVKYASFAASAGDRTLSIPVSSLAAGTYVVAFTQLATGRIYYIKFSKL